MTYNSTRRDKAGYRASGPCSALRGRPAGAWTPSSPATRRQSAARSQRGIDATSGARRTTSGADLFATWSDAASRITRSSHWPTVSPSRRAAMTAMSRASVDIDLMVHGCILSMGSRTPWSSRLQTGLTARDATDSWQGTEGKPFRLSALRGTNEEAPGGWNHPRACVSFAARTGALEQEVDPHVLAKLPPGRKPGVRLWQSACLPAPLPSPRGGGQ